MIRTLFAALLALVVLTPAQAGGRLSARGTPAVVVNVTNDATRDAALITANAGKVIRLAPGSYSRLDCGSKFFPAIQVVSADPMNPAIMSDGFVASDCTGMWTRGLTFKTGSIWHKSVKVSTGGVNILIDGGEMVSTVTPSIPNYVDGANGGNGGDAGIQIDNSPLGPIIVQNVNIHHVHGGFGATRSNNIYFTGNRITDNYHDDISGISQVIGFTGKNNYAKDFYFCDAVIVVAQCPPLTQGQAEHGDFFQANTVSGPSAFITLDGNVFGRGLGQAFQGYFLGNETSGIYLTSTVAADVLTIVNVASQPVGGQQPLAAGSTVTCGGCVPGTTILSQLSGASPCTTASGGAPCTFRLSVDNGTLSSRTITVIKWPYDHVVMDNSLIYGAVTNGITCGGCTHFKVRGNTVQSWLDTNSQINWEGGYDGEVSGNFSTVFSAIQPPSDGTYQSTPNSTPCSACMPPAQ